MRLAFALCACVTLGCAGETPRTPPPETSPRTDLPASPAEPAPPAEAPFDLTAHVGDKPACLLVTESSGEVVERTEGERCGQRFTPASTFKIPNSIIGLETKVVADADSVIAWDREKYPKQAWWPKTWTDRKHDLRSAFRHSFVPFYRSLATKVGREPMQQHVDRFRYGNRELGEQLDAFWLDGALTISADEQVAFLRSFHAEELGVSPRTTEIVKDILVHTRRDDRTLSAKTGTGKIADGTAIGWLVGYVERGEDVHFFAFNVSGPTFDDIPRTWRQETVERMLAELGLWE